jgi:phosphoribosyl-ATP pyrophosphohydrolase/phosphoribosyl-AMP cyclohydrolase
MLDLARLTFEKGGGLVTVVAQDARTGAVLMVAYADRTALERTIETGEMHYHSRSRGMWHKGATSGNTQRVVSLTPDCDGDAVLARVHPAGPACHTGEISCFGEAAVAADALSMLDRVLGQRAAAYTATGSASSYTQRLLADRNLRLKKLGEETAELIIACADGDAGRGSQEGMDVLYHTLVALRALGVTIDDLRSIAIDRAR